MQHYCHKLQKRTENDMSDEIRPVAEAIPQTGEAAWFPPVEDDAESLIRAGEPKGARWFFFGKDGLRAGWSFALFLVFLLVLMFAESMLYKALHLGRLATRPGTETSAWTPILFTHGGPFLAAILAAWFMVPIEKRRMAQYGLGSLRTRITQFVGGGVCGFVLFSALIATLFFTHVLVFDRRQLDGSFIVQWGAVWALAFLCVALFEEYLTRGYLQFTLSRGLAGIAGALGMQDRGRRALGFWLSALFFSFLFGLGHKGNPGESPIGLVSAGLIGLIFTFSLWRTGSLWWAVGWHAAWDWAESFVYGVRDSGTTIQHALYATHPQGAVLLSGGLTGPEGSAYVLGIIALTAIIIAITLPSQPGSPSDPNYTPNADLLTR